MAFEERGTPPAISDSMLQGAVVHEAQSGSNEKNCTRKHYRLQSPPAIVIGTCAHGLALIHALSNAGVSVISLDTNPTLPGTRTRFSSVELIPDINGPALLDALLDLHARIEAPDKPVLFLNNDRMVRTLGVHWHRLADKFHLSWSACSNTLLPLLEKDSLELRCQQTGLRYPETCLIHNDSDARTAVTIIGFPMIIKPVRPLSGFKTFLPTNADELLRWTEIHQPDLPFVAQRFIPGDDRAIYFSALYLDAGKVLARFDGHKLRSRPLGHTTIAESFRNEEVYRQTLDFFAGLNLSGPVSLEVKKAPDDSYWVMEPTVGRTDFWVGLCIANGINLPYVEYLHQTGQSIPNLAQQDQAVWFNEERDPFGRFWFAAQPDLGLKGRRACYLYLKQKDGEPAKQALKEIGKQLGRAAAKRLVFR
ncbi:MAG: hypothetical protein JNK92_12110 [Dechloromonas sp.]|nr:hypothetical protein [Dechloromonas sp.]